MRRKARTSVPQTAPQVSQPPRRGASWRQVLIFLLAVMAYSSAVTSPLMFDDQTSIVSNVSIRSLTPLSGPLSPPRDTPVAGRPLVNLLFAVNYAIDGIGVRGYHVVNILLHVGVALALFGVVRRALRLPGLVDRFGAQADNLALACALVWGLHPLNSEVVNYLTQRSESLMALFFMLTLYASLRAHERPARMWDVVAVLTCAAGMLSKESMVTAPLIVVLVDRALVFPSWREAFAERRPLYLGLFATWVILASILATEPRTSVGFAAGTTPFTYFLNQLEIIPRYLGLAFWPRALVLDYGLPRPLTIGQVWPGLLLLTGLGMATLVAMWKRPRLGLLGAWFFITLAPASSFVPVATEVGAERRMYLPLMAIVVLVVFAAYTILMRERPAVAESQPTGARPLVPAVVLGVVCLLLIGGVLLRNQEYSSRLQMAQTIVDRWPNGRGRFLLASELVEAGRNAEALTQFRESAKDYPGADFALGTELVAAGQTDEGVAALERFIKADPQHAVVIPAREMLGTVYLNADRLEQAETHVRLLLERVPAHAGARRLMGDIRLRQSNPAQAVVEYRESLRLQPTQPETLGNLGFALAAIDRFDEAASVLREAVVLAPQDPAAHLLLGRVLSVQRKYEEAESEFAAAVELDPESRDARTNLESVRRLIARNAGTARTGGAR